MHHLQPPFTRPDFTKTTHFVARRHHGALNRAEMEKTKRDGAGTIRHLHHKHTLFAVLNVGGFYLTLNTHVSKRLTIFNLVNLSAVFITGWQMEKDILYGVQTYFC